MNSLFHFQIKNNLGDSPEQVVLLQIYQSLEPSQDLKN